MNLVQSPAFLGFLIIYSYIHNNIPAIIIRNSYTEEKVLQCVDYKILSKIIAPILNFTFHLLEKYINDYQRSKNASNVNFKIDHQLLIQFCELIAYFCFSRKLVIFINAFLNYHIIYNA